MRRALMILALAAPLFGQQSVRWFATTGDVVLSTQSTVATIQQPATNASQVQLEQIVVYCSANCDISQSANGAGATATAGTITPILPNQLNLPITATFWTGSNVGAGTAQGGIYHQSAAGTVVFCLNTNCGAYQNVSLGTGGTSSNYSVNIASFTGTVNITFYGRSVQ